MKPGIVVLGVGLLSAVLAWGAWASSSRVFVSASPAVPAYLAALDAEMEFDDERALLRLFEAIGTDPTYVPAYEEILAISRSAYYLPPWVLARLDTLAADDSSGCVAVVLAAYDTRTIQLGPHAHPDCLTLAQHRDLADPDLAVSAGAVLSGRYPESPTLAFYWFIEHAGDPKTYRTRARDFARRRAHPLMHAVARAATDAAAIVAGLTAGESIDAVASGDRDDGAVGVHYLEARRALVQTHARIGPPSRVVEEFIRDEAHRVAARAARYPVADRFARLDRAHFLLDNGHLVGALAVWDSLVADFDRTGELELRALAYMRRGRTQVKLGNPAEAESDLLHARTMAAASRPLWLAYEAEHNLLHLYEGQGRESEARQAGRRFVELTHEGGLSEVRMMSAHDVGWYLLRLGDLEAARPYFSSMVADIDSLGSQFYYAAEYYKSIGDLDRAAVYLRRHLNEDDGEPALAVRGLAEIAEAFGDFEEAERWARIHDEELAARPGYPDVYPILPGLIARSGDSDRARAAFARGRETASRRGQRVALGRLLIESAELELERGSHDAALRLADSAVAIAASVADPELTTLAPALDAAVRLATGASTIEPAATAGDLVRLERTLESVDSRRLPLSTARVHRWAATAALARGLPTAALRHLGVAAAAIDTVAAGIAEDADRAAYLEAAQTLSDLALKVILEAGGPDVSVRLTEWSVRRKARWARDGVDGSTAPAVGPVAARLADDQAVVDFLITRELGVALVFRRSGSRVVRLNATGATLGERVRLLTDEIAPRVGSSVDLGHSRLNTELSGWLASTLIDPLELDDLSRVTFVPDGPLHELPWAVLRSRADGPYLIERWEISVAPSLARAGRREPDRPPRSVVAVRPDVPAGDDLGTADEVLGIKSVWGPEGFVELAGRRATESAVIAAAGGADVLHFASHASPNDQVPDFARVELTPDGADDGYLHAFEVRKLALPGTLVVLSACDTGRGRLSGGEGVLSLARAFLQAGAAGVVATQWPIGAPTAELMRTFYSELRLGASPAGALRAAQLEMLSGSRSSPVFWAPFVLVEG